MASFTANFDIIGSPLEKIGVEMQKLDTEMVSIIATNSAKLYNIGCKIFTNDPKDFKFNFALNEVPMQSDDSTLGFYEKKI